MGVLNRAKTAENTRNHDTHNSQVPKLAGIDSSKKPWIDRGWAWVVAFGGLIVMYAAIGQMRCLGLYFAELQKLFNEGSMVAAILPSVLFAMAPIMSLISSALASLYGTRPVVLIGIAFSVLAYVLTFFSANTAQFIIFYSLPSSLGLGLIYTPTQILVACYFVKNSSLAQGIINTGSSLAGISLPYIFSFLVDAYGFRGTMLILGGILANMMMAAMLFRPLEFWEPAKAKSTFGKQQDTANGNDYEGNASRGQYENSTDEDNEDRVSLFKDDSSAEHRTMYNVSATGSMIILDKIFTASQQELENIQKLEQTEGREENPSKLRRWLSAINKVMNFSLLKKPAFLIHTVSSGCGFAVYMVTSVMLPSHAIDLGIPKDKSYALLSIGTIAEVPARILITFLADRWGNTKRGQKFQMMSVCMVLSGVFSFLMSNSTTYINLAVYFSIHTFLMGGGFLALNVDVLRDAIGLEKLSNGGLGLSLLFTGITNGLAPLFVGAMRDYYGNYKGGFNLLGSMGIIGGLLLWLQLVVQRREKANRIQMDETSVEND